jgi:MFS family permease
MQPVQHQSSRVTQWLRNSNGFLFSTYATVAAFCLYTCIFAFRKTYTVGTFDGLVFLGITYKSWLVITQVIGYGLAKFLGIKLISELKSSARVTGILIMIAIAGTSWLLFAITPPPYNIIFLFTNGLPLGMGWGLVFSYLEGRRFTEVLGAGVSVSFIFSSGFAKSVGGFVMKFWGVSEYWMPFVSACIFLLPLLFFLWMLNQVPPPDALDESLRTRRQPMNQEERRKFLFMFGPGLVLLILTYMLLTAFRDFRDNFSADVWKTLGYGDSPGIFTKTEVPVTIAILIIMGSIMFIRSNRMAFMINHVIILAGMLLVGITTYLFEQHLINATHWMILLGMGLYMGYVPFNSILFDRMIATFKYVSTVGFLIYLADAFGYLGSIGVLLYKEFGQHNLSWLEFFIQAGYIMAVAGSLLIIASMIYFYFKHQHWIKINREATR